MGQIKEFKRSVEEVDNKSSLLIKMYPAIGIQSFSGIINVGFNSATSISFRYSINGGVKWSNWSEYNSSNIIAITSQTIKSLVMFEILAEGPVGVDWSTSSTSISTVLDSNYLDENYYYNESIFAQFFDIDDEELLQWVANVLQKIYAKGLVADYIERLNEEKSPDDYVEFWIPIITFFAYYVRYCREYEMFYDSLALLEEYLMERGLEVSKENILSNMQELMKHFNRYILERGTINIINKEQPYGEFLRLIDYKDQDEFLFNLYKPEHFGWTLGKSSPLYRNLYLNDSLNKAYETYSDEIKDKAFYPLTNSANVSVVTDEGRSVLKFDSQSGIGYSNDSSFLIKANPKLSYEISFLIKEEDLSFDGIRFGVQCFDKDKNIIANATISNKDGSNSSLFIDGFVTFRNDKYIFVRGIVYNQGKDFSQYDSLNINQGNNLIFSSDDICYMAPVVYNQDTSSGSVVYVHSLRILPLLTPYSRGFIQVKNWIDVWMDNRNKTYSLQEVKDYVRKYLIPYNTVIAINQVGDYIYNGQETEGSGSHSYIWVPIGEYCEVVKWIGGDPSCEQETSTTTTSTSTSTTTTSSTTSTTTSSTTTTTTEAPTTTTTTEEPTTTTTSSTTTTTTEPPTTTTTTEEPTTTTTSTSSTTTTTTEPPTTTTTTVKGIRFSVVWDNTIHTNALAPVLANVVAVSSNNVALYNGQTVDLSVAPYIESNSNSQHASVSPFHFQFDITQIFAEREARVLIYRIEDGGSPVLLQQNVITQGFHGAYDLPTNANDSVEFQFVFKYTV